MAKATNGRKDTKHVSKTRDIGKRKKVRKEHAMSSDDSASSVTYSEDDAYMDEATAQSSINFRNNVVDDSFKDLMNATKRKPAPPTPAAAPNPKPAFVNSQANNNAKKKQPVPEPSPTASTTVMVTTGSSATDSEANEDDIVDDSDAYSSEAYVESSGSEGASDEPGSDDGGEATISQEVAQSATLNNINNTDARKSIGAVSMQNHDPRPTMQGSNYMNEPRHAAHKGPAHAGASIVEASEGFGSIEEEKADLLFKIDRLRTKGYHARKMDDNFSIIEIRKEYNRLKSELELEHSIGFSRKILMAVISTIEFLNKRYDPFDLALDGWSESVMENINSYDNILERLYYKYRNRVAMPPELELLVTLAGSAFMFHMTHSLFKAAIPNIQKNPDLMQSMMNAFTNIASQANKAAAPPQPAAQQAYSAPHAPSPTPVSAPSPQARPAEAAPQATEAPQKPYKMKGPDFDISSLTGGINPMSILPGLTSLLGANNAPPENPPVRSAASPASVAASANASSFPGFVPVMLNPVPSDMVQVPKRTIEVEDERFYNANAMQKNTNLNGANLGLQLGDAMVKQQNNSAIEFPAQPVVTPVAQAASNANAALLSMNAVPANAREVPILPDPPMLKSDSLEEIDDTPSVTQTPTVATTVAIDEDRLSDINSDELESIRTDALSTVISDDEKTGTKTVSVTQVARAQARRGRQKKAGQSSAGKVIVI